MPVDDSQVIVAPPLTRLLRRLGMTRHDLAVAGVVAIPVLGVALVRANRGHHPVLELPLAVVALVAVLLCRRRPLAALALALAVIAASPGNGALLLPALVALYNVAATRAWQGAAAAGVAVTVTYVLANISWGTVSGSNHLGLLYRLVLITVAFCGTALALGLYAGARRRVLDALRERAERADRERELLAERAVAEERVRIAQELHDVVAHNVSLMVVQAQGLGVTVEDRRVAETTEAIADLGRDAMAEMHRTLRLLRAGDTESAQLAPQPGLADLDRLLEQSRAAGLEVELTIEGALRQLPQAVDLSAFRIVQEAMTNVIKHAAGAPATVTLSYGEQALRLTILDSGSPTDDAPSGGHIAAGSGEDGAPSWRPGLDGHGVLGMRERVALFGGALTVEPRRGRGFVVTATLPYVETES